MAQLLSKGEIVVHHIRIHIKAVLGSIIAEILFLAGDILATIYMSPEWGPFSLVFVWVIALVATLPLLPVPILRWTSSTYTLISKRVITRYDILNRRGHGLPLSCISNVANERDLVDRPFGCGTLTLQTSSDDPLILHGIPEIDYV